MRRLFIIAIIIIFGLNTFASIVTIDNARIVAQNFYFEKVNSIKSISKEALKISDEIVVSNNNVPVYYIFNMLQNNGVGFIIVSAESNVTPVLAYSFENNYSANTLIPTVKWILTSYQNEIINARNNNIQATEEINRLWNLYSSNNKSTTATNQVLPMLGTLNWDQGCYYNTSCPTDVDAGFCNHNPTGCVATAMAQIMKYNAYPSQGSGSYSYIHSTAYGYKNNYGTLSANFGATTYNWASMPNVVNSSNTDVALLMSQCGISVGMSYDVNGSGAIVGGNYQGATAEKALKNYFKYSTAIYYKKSSYTETQWQNVLLSDLNANRPILYAGDDGSTAGHCFVMDGYQTSASLYHYHFNFGWSGQGNGYFYIDTINPGSGGVGGGTYNFSKSEEGVFNIAKSTAGIETNVKPEINIYPNPSNGIINIEIPYLNSSKFIIKVYNLVGELVSERYYTPQNNTLNVDYGFLTKGLYFFTIFSDSNTITKKITILK